MLIEALFLPQSSKGSLINAITLVPKKADYSIIGDSQELEEEVDLRS